VEKLHVLHTEINKPLLY